MHNEYSKGAADEVCGAFPAGSYTHLDVYKRQEYIMAGGNDNVIRCERGILTFEKYTRNTLDLSVVPLVKQKSQLPIIIDPSHATGDWRLVESMSLAAIAAGADGLILEVHNHPEKAWSDGAQSLKVDKFKTLIEKGRKIAQVIGREMAVSYTHLI